ncbi:MAG: hypothetical protein ABJC89_17820 [Acidobacteriota bacterium]
MLLNRLSVFPASWTLDAAATVCAGDGILPQDMLDLLSRLVSKSLLALECGWAGERRYQILETVRHYAWERLAAAGDGDLLRNRHTAFFCAEFKSALPILRGPEQVPCLRRLGREQGHVRAALDWALDSAALAGEGVELAGALFWFWTKRGLFEEGRTWLERAVALDTAPRTRARALIGLAHMHYFQGRQIGAAESAAAALSLGRECGDPWVVSFALFLQALTAFELGDYQRALARAIEAREAADESGDQVQHGGPLMILANVALFEGDHGRAQQLYDESIEVHRRAGDKWGLSILLSIGPAHRAERLRAGPRASRRGDLVV